MTDITTLPQDIYDVLSSESDDSLSVEGGVDFGQRLTSHINGALYNKPRERKPNSLYASEIGKPCTRQLYYSRTLPEQGEKMRGATFYKFLYGNVIEEITLELAKQAGHTVEAEQLVFERKVGDWKIRGRCDAVIDNHMVDVKSASKFAFQKYEKAGAVTSDNDSFGYRHQLHFYGSDEKAIAEENRDFPFQSFEYNENYFLFVSKELGNISLIRNDITEGEYESDVEYKVDALSKALKDGVAPERCADGTKLEDNGNVTLKAVCSYCSFKKVCYGDDLRAYIYSTGPKYFVDVKKEPRVDEIPI